MPASDFQVGPSCSQRSEGEIVRPGRMRPLFAIVIWPAFAGVPVAGNVGTMPQVCVGLQLPGATRLIVKVCERVAKFSFSMPYWNPKVRRSWRAGFQSTVVEKECRVVCLPLSRHENVPK